MNLKGIIISKWYGIAAALALLLLILAFIKIDQEESTVIQNGHFGTIVDLEMLPDDVNFVSSAYDYKIKLWNLKEKEHLRTIDTNLHVIKDFATSKKMNVIYGVGNEGVFHLWDSETYNSIKKFDPLYFPIEELILSDDEGFLAAKTKDLVIIFEILSETELSQPLFLNEEMHEEVQGFFFKDDFLLSIGSEGNIHFWDYRSGKLQKTIETGYSIEKGDLSNDSDRIVVGYNDSSVDDVSVLELWNLAQKKREQTLGKCDGKVLDILARSFDDKAVVSCSQSPLFSFNFGTPQSANKLMNENKPGLRGLTYSYEQDALLYRYGDNIEILWNFKNSI